MRGSGMTKSLKPISIRIGIWALTRVAEKLALAPS